MRAVAKKVGVHFPIEWSLHMKNMRTQFFLALTAIAVAFVLTLPAHAQNTSETLYKGKCAGCHGADGTGSATGKKMGAHDFTSADVQKMSDAELTDVITNGKNKMPKYPTLKPEDIKGLVGYIRTLKK
jgi:mono/diheme cytochrome c family protein